MIFIGKVESGDQQATDKMLEEMNRMTVEWTMKAARGECGWICADCSCSFPDGMPDQCAHGHESCTRIIQRDKLEARGRG